jgi:hypothetical protein
MKRFSIVLACLSLVFVSLPATAAGVVANDPDDVDGFLDLAELSVEAVEGESGFFKITTHEGYACNYLKPESKKTYLKLLFDDGRDGDTDLVGRFECVDNKLFMFLHGKETGNNYEGLRVDRPRAKVSKVSFQMDLEEFQSNKLGVVVKSKDATNTECQETACKDRIPESGSLKVY